ncbi:MAG: hypothetical protein AAGE52_05265 [Myxococcota bacterium]
MRWGFLLVIVAATASAQDAPEAPERRQATAYVQQLRQGITQLVDGDATGAMTTFQEAIRSEPEQPEGHCHLAAAQRQNGDLQNAVESFRTCARLARQAGDVLNEGRGLLGTVQILVLDREQRTPAREAVSALLRYAETHGDTIPLPLVQELQQRLDSIIELDVVSQEVRARREARAAQTTEE